MKAMHYLEVNEDDAVIEALQLPLTYTGQTLHISEKITTETEWNENLDALLNAIENEKGIPFADWYISRLYSYTFIETATVRDYTRQIVFEEH